MGTDGKFPFSENTKNSELDERVTNKYQKTSRLREFFLRMTEFRPILVSLIVGLLCFTAVSNGQQRKGSIDNIVSSFPGYHLLTLKELDPDAKAFFLKRFPKASPSVVHADFDGDGHLDYALLLRNDKSQVTKLVVLLCPEDGHCRNVYELDVSAYSGSAYLRPASRGSGISQTESIDTDTGPVNLKFSGIRVTYFGKGEVVLYWDERLKKIHAITTAD